MILSCDGICPFIWNAQKIEEFHFRAKYLKFPIFPIWLWKWEIWGIATITNIHVEKWGISNNSHVINFINYKISIIEKEPKMKFFHFWAFQINEQMPWHEKIIFHMLFGVFHITLRKPILRNIKIDVMTQMEATGPEDPNITVCLHGFFIRQYFIRILQYFIQIFY